jgi:hypothetical protein
MVTVFRLTVHYVIITFGENVFKLMDLYPGEGLIGYVYDVGHSSKR